MGIFDIFTNDAAQKAAADQTAGLNAGYGLASGAIDQGIGALNTNYTKALTPFTTNFGNANAGVTQLGNVLGLNGPTAGNTAKQFMENTPGFQFQKEQGDSAINAYEAATGKTASGNQMLDLSKFNQGLAGTTYNNYVSQLQPYLGAAGGAASGIANVNTGLGNATANQYDQKAQLGYATQTGIGNANANADLAANNASGNFWNMLGSLGGMKTAGGGSVGGNLMSGIGSAASSAAGGIGDALMAFLPMLSDERLKEDIEPVGELFDGQKVYSYRYVGSMMPHIGLMAQEVEKVHPEAVVEIGGYKAVDYRKATRFASELSRFLEAA